MTSSDACWDTYKENTCGEGSKTWDPFQMRSHKWLTDLHSDIRQIIFISTEPGEMEVITLDT